MGTSTLDSLKWWTRLGRRGTSSDPHPDVMVAMWKAAWVKGANAAWSPGRLRVNPYPPGVQRSAWDAGWEWAGRNPDRRDNRTMRLAHPHRRYTDSTIPTSVRRAVRLGATGVTIYAISRALRRWVARRPV